MGLFCVPIFGLMRYVALSRRDYDASGEDPFTDLPTRPAGESLRLRIEELRETQQDALGGRLIAAIIAATVASTVSSPQRLLIAGGLAVAVLADFAINAPKIYRVTAKLRNIRLGYRGERVVGEHLTQLLPAGYSVFHDVPFPGYNLDHVVVGPNGVFSVETKTRRKPKHNGKKGEHRVIFDGQKLHWPNHSESNSLTQALAGARSLSKFLSDSTGDRVEVQPILTAPGWWIDDNTQHPVWVLNPKRIKPFVQAHARATLSEKRIRAIAYQLAQRCQLTTE